MKIKNVIKYICLHSMMGCNAPTDREEAMKLILRVSEIEPIAENNLKLLKERIAKSMAMYECIEWFRVIRTVYHHRETPAGRSKRISDTERAYADTAKRYLYAELSTVLQIPVSEVEEHILRHAGVTT